MLLVELTEAVSDFIQIPKSLIKLGVKAYGWELYIDDSDAIEKFVKPVFGPVAEMEGMNDLEYVIVMQHTGGHSLVIRTGEGVDKRQFAVHLRATKKKGITKLYVKRSDLFHVATRIIEHTRKSTGMMESVDQQLVRIPDKIIKKKIEGMFDYISNNHLKPFIDNVIGPAIDIQHVKDLEYCIYMPMNKDDTGTIQVHYRIGEKGPRANKVTTLFRHGNGYYFNIVDLINQIGEVASKIKVHKRLYGRNAMFNTRGQDALNVDRPEVTQPDKDGPYPVPLPP